VAIDCNVPRHQRFEVFDGFCLGQFDEERLEIPVAVDLVGDARLQQRVQV
jgi:hypothetical protein